MLAQIWGGSKTSTVDDFNPYVLSKRKSMARRSGMKFSEAVPLLQQFVPKPN